MLLSSFELLLKKITPNPGNISGSDRNILQGYFLNISNPNPDNLRIRLRFNATTPSIDPSKLLDVLDTDGTNNFSGSLIADGSNRFRYDFTLNAGDTGLFILQPNILALDPARDEVEVRGFVEIFTVVPIFTFGPPRELLVTPEHRGTFVASSGGNNEFDQLNVPLPTATGAGLIAVDSISDFPIFDGPLTPIPVPDFTRPPVPPVQTTNTEALGATQLQVTLPQILNTMAQRIATLEENLKSS